MVLFRSLQELKGTISLLALREEKPQELCAPPAASFQAAARLFSILRDPESAATFVYHPDLSECAHALLGCPRRVRFTQHCALESAGGVYTADTPHPARDHRDARAGAHRRSRATQLRLQSRNPRQMLSLDEDWRAVYLRRRCVELLLSCDLSLKYRVRGVLDESDSLARIRQPFADPGFGAAILAPADYFPPVGGGPTGLVRMGLFPLRRC